MKGLIKDMGLTLGGDLSITLTVPRVHQANVAKLLGEPVSVELKKYRERRSLTQNAYLWELIVKIAQELKPPIPQDEAYEMMLKRYGQCGMLTIREDQFENVIRSIKYWEHKGEGMLNGKKYTHVMAYVGSSNYNTLEMSILIDGVVQEAKELGIETLTPAELAALKCV